MSNKNSARYIGSHNGPLLHIMQLCIVVCTHACMRCCALLYALVHAFVAVSAGLGEAQSTARCRSLRRSRDRRHLAASRCAGQLQGQSLVDATASRMRLQKRGTVYLPTHGASIILFAMLGKINYAQTHYVAL